MDRLLSGDVIHWEWTGQCSRISPSDELTRWQSSKLFSRDDDTHYRDTATTFQQQQQQPPSKMNNCIALGVGYVVVRSSLNSNAM